MSARHSRTSRAPAPDTEQTKTARLRELRLSNEAAGREAGTWGAISVGEITHTVKVSAHGGMIPLDAQMTFGETFMLKHSARPEEHPCKVVFLGSDNKSGKSLVGFEFTNGMPDFWHVYFPPVTNSKPNGNGETNGNGNGILSGESSSGRFYLP